MKLEAAESRARFGVETPSKDTFALSPFASEIACIGVHSSVTGSSMVLVNGTASIKQTPNGFLVRNYADEAGMLHDFWEICHRQKDNGFCSYNGRGFDVPVLTLRSIKHGLTPCSKLVHANRYWTKTHLDLKDAAEGFGSARFKWNLALLCEMLDVKTSKDDLHGNEVGAAWRSGEIDRVVAYCAEDVRATAECAAKMMPTFCG